MLAMASCHTNENNMRAAYDRTIAAQEAQDSDMEDNSTYTAIRREMRRGEMAVNGDTLPVGSQFVSITPDGGGIPEYIRRYMVVAGQFKQVFNAKSMRERMVDSGYPGAFVVQTREPYYYVIAASYSEAAPAAEMYHRLQSDPDLKIKSPLPFILSPSQIR